MVLKKDGSVWATGWNINGRLGDGTRSTQTTFVRVVKGAPSDTTKSAVTPKPSISTSKSGCGNWCASRSASWKTKCTWTKKCGGCPECSDTTKRAVTTKLPTC